MIFQLLIFHFTLHFNAAKMASTKIKILCLHGYQQNARMIMEKTGALRKFIKNVEFHSLDAPFKVVANVKDDEKDPRSWYFTNTNNTCHWNEKDDCFGLERSLEVIKEKYEKDGPYQGLLGFSQGAALAAIVCAIDQMNGMKRFDFVIVISGFKSFTTSHTKFYEQIIDTPSLHIIGDADAQVEKYLSEDLTKQFNPETRKIMIHQKGHMIPFDKEIKFVYKNFIDKFLNLNNPPGDPKSNIT